MNLIPLFSIIFVLGLCVVAGVCFYNITGKIKANISQSTRRTLIAIWILAVAVCIFLMFIGDAFVATIALGF
jgi:hypothetical protein